MAETNTILTEPKLTKRQIGQRARRAREFGKTEAEQEAASKVRQIRAQRKREVAAMLEHARTADIAAIPEHASETPSRLNLNEIIAHITWPS